MLTTLLMRLKRRDEELPDFNPQLLACYDSVNGVFPQKEAFLLHVIGDARAQFHGGRECEASGRRGRHVGLQNRFQRVQDIILAHLTESRVNTQRERRVFPICKDTFNKS